jgi:hypothetical protein
MRMSSLTLILLFALAPLAQARDHGGHHRHDHRGRSRCWEAPRWSHRARWERRHRCGEDRRWEREAWIQVPAPSFHVRIQLP